jgi:hypothetical protein
LTVRRPGRVIRHLNITGRVVVEAPNVTIDDVCVTYDGGGQISAPPAVELNAPGDTLQNSVVRGANATNHSVQIALGEDRNNGSGLSAIHDYVYNCSECVHNDGWTLRDSYVLANGAPCSSGYSGTTCQGEMDHREDIYCDSGSITATHDTLLNPTDQTAAIFCNINNGNGGPCPNQVAVSDSLLAGGGYLIYTCAHTTGVGASRMTFTDNDLARCGQRPTYQPATGGRTCGHIDAAADNGRGYWPLGGYFGVSSSVYCPPTPGQIWARNFWDDTGRPVAC